VAHSNDILKQSQALLRSCKSRSNRLLKEVQANRGNLETIADSNKKRKQKQIQKAVEAQPEIPKGRRVLRRARKD
jgi:hypothetical protein